MAFEWTTVAFFAIFLLCPLMHLVMRRRGHGKGKKCEHEKSIKKRDVVVATNLLHI